MILASTKNTPPQRKKLNNNNKQRVDAPIFCVIFKKYLANRSISQLLKCKLYCFLNCCYLFRTGSSFRDPSLWRLKLGTVNLKVSKTKITLKRRFNATAEKDQQLSITETNSSTTRCHCTSIKFRSGV